MSEENKKETEEKKPEEGTPDDGKGDKSKSTSLVDRANEAAERMEKANAQTAELIAKQQELMAHQKLSGNLEGGQVAVEKEETPKEYNDRIEKEISEGKHDE